jgi:serine/threonine protein kinase
VSDDGTPQLSDFGRSRVIDHRGFTTATLAGSARQLAPELLQPEEVDSGDDLAIRMTKEGDIYAFAMVALEVRESLCV